MSAAHWGRGGTEISPGPPLGPQGQQGPWAPPEQSSSITGSQGQERARCWRTCFLLLLGQWPPTWRLKTTRCFSDSLESSGHSVFLGWNQADGKDLLPPEAHGKIFLFALSSFQSSMSCAWERSLLLQYCIATSSQQISLCLSLTRTFVITFRAHPDNPG